MAGAINSFKELTDMGRDKNFSIDSLVDGMKDYNMKDLCFMRDCIDFMIIYNKYKREA